MHGEPWLWESEFCQRNKQFCGRMGKGGGGRKALNKDSWSPPSFPTALQPVVQPASRWWGQITLSNPALPLAVTGAGWLGRLQGCSVTLGIYFSKNQAALREWALIRPSIGSFGEQSANQVLFGKLFPSPPRQLDNSLSWWNFSPPGHSCNWVSKHGRAERRNWNSLPFSLARCVSLLFRSATVVPMCEYDHLLEWSIYMVLLFNLAPLLSTLENKRSQCIALMISKALVARCACREPEPRRLSASEPAPRRLREPILRRTLQGGTSSSWLTWACVSEIGSWRMPKNWGWMGPARTRAQLWRFRKAWQGGEA